jgi:hypothetical protein
MAVCDNCDRLIRAEDRTCPFCKHPRSLAEGLLPGKPSPRSYGHMILLIAGLLVVAALLCALVFLS